MVTTLEIPETEIEEFVDSVNEVEASQTESADVETPDTAP
jgi:hypothetical protein